MRTFVPCVWFVAMAWAASPAVAAEGEFATLRAEMAEMRRAHAAAVSLYEARLADLQARLERLERGPAPPVSGGSLRERLAALAAGTTPASSGAAAVAVASAPGAPRGAGSSNPDLSANIDFLGHASSLGLAPGDEPLQVREVELGIQSSVDPFGKYALILGIEQEAPGEYALGVEEAYFTFSSFAPNTTLRVGKFRAAFGKANETHLHALPWHDYPRALALCFGDEGLTGTGVSASWLVPGRSPHRSLEATLEVFDDDNESMFAGGDATDVTGLLHVKSFFELSPARTLELGASLATGRNEGAGPGRSWVEGLDLTLRYRPPRAGLYHSWEWRSELFSSQKDLAGGGEPHALGFYSSVERQFERQWSVGLRYDQAEQPDEPDLLERDWTGYLTFRQSEFAFWRFGVRHRSPSGDPLAEDEELVFLQFNTSIGAHPAHKY